MNRRLVPIIAASLILVIALGSTPFSYALTRATNGPKLEVITIPEDDQKREKGIIILGLWFDAEGAQKCTTDPKQVYDPVLNPTGLPLCGPQDLMSQHKLLVTYNGQTLKWRLGDSGNGVPVIACNVVEKDKVNVIPDPKTGKGKQFPQENLMTKLVDVSDQFICKPRWKSPAEGWLESAGVLDVYYVGPYDIHWVADHILVVEATLTVGRTVVWGSDIQDICVLAWPWYWAELLIRKPEWFTTWDHTFPDEFQKTHSIWWQALGPWASCEELALILGVFAVIGQALTDLIYAVSVYGADLSLLPYAVGFVLFVGRIPLFPLAAAFGGYVGREYFAGKPKKRSGER